METVEIILGTEHSTKHTTYLEDVIIAKCI